MYDPFTTLQPMAGETFYPGYDADGNPVAIYGPNTEEFRNAIYGTNTGPYAANADALRFPSASTIAPPDDNFDAANAQRVFYSEPTTVMEYNMAVNNSKTTPPVTSPPTNTGVDAVTGASPDVPVAPVEITPVDSATAESVVGYADGSTALTAINDPMLPPDAFLGANGITNTSFFGHKNDYGSYGAMVSSDPSTGMYSFSNEETHQRTYVNCNTQQIIISKPDEDGNTILTIYTTDSETTGYTVNATALGLKVNEKGELVDESGEFTVTLSPDEVKDLYERTTSPGYSGQTFYSGNLGVEDIGTFDYTGSSKNDVDTHPDAYRHSFNSLLIDNGIQPLGIVDSYSDYYDVALENDLFNLESDRFNTTITNMIDNNDGEWKSIDTALNGVLEQYKDLFNVGGKNISDLVGPVKEALSNAQSQITAYLEAISAEYSAVSARKQAELERLAALAKKQTGSSAN